MNGSLLVYELLTIVVIFLAIHISAKETSDSEIRFT